MLVLPITSSLNPDQQFAQPTHSLSTHEPPSSIRNKTIVQANVKTSICKGGSQARRGKGLCGGRAGQASPGRARAVKGGEARGQVRGAGKVHPIAQRQGHNADIGNMQEYASVTVEEATIAPSMCSDRGVC